MTSATYLALTLAFYAVGALHVLVHVLTRRRLLTALAATATLLGFAFHTAALSLRWVEIGHFPAIGLRDGSSFLAWATALVLLLVYVTTRVDALGFIAYPVAFGLVFVANLTPDSARADLVLRSIYLPVHTVLASFGYGALFVAFTMGVLYLLQDHELRSRSPRRFYYMIPSLERCDTIGGQSVIGGFGFLTFAIATGFLWNRSLVGRYWTGDAKEWAALTAWIIYVLLIVARQRAGWGGRPAAWLGIAGFTVVAFTFAWATLVPVAAATR